MIGWTPTRSSPPTDDAGATTAALVAAATRPANAPTSGSRAPMYGRTCARHWPQPMTPRTPTAPPHGRRHHDHLEANARPLRRRGLRRRPVVHVRRKGTRSRRLWPLALATPTPRADHPGVPALLDR